MNRHSLLQALPGRRRRRRHCRLTGGRRRVTAPVGRPRRRFGLGKRSGRARHRGRASVSGLGFGRLRRSWRVGRPCALPHEAQPSRTQHYHAKTDFRAQFAEPAVEDGAATFMGDSREAKALQAWLALEDHEELTIACLLRRDALRLAQQNRLVDNVGAGGRRPLEERSCRREAAVCARVEDDLRGRWHRRKLLRMEVPRTSGWKPMLMR